MPWNRLVHHVDEWQVGIALCCGIEPFYDGFVLFLLRKVVNPSWILSAPNQAMELAWEFVVFRIVVAIVKTAPVELSASATFHRPPFRFVLGGDLVPEGCKRNAIYIY